MFHHEVMYTVVYSIAKPFLSMIAAKLQATRNIDKYIPLTHTFIHIISDFIH